VIVSPSDVSEERDAFEDAIKNANQIVSRQGVVFTSRRWEDLSPGYHPEGAQALIDSELNIEQCDLLVGILWKRFGVVDEPPYSRTAREILLALEVRSANSIRPDVKVYFCKRLYFPSTVEEAEGQALVLRFKQELEKSIIYREYADVGEFRFCAFRDLIEYLGNVGGMSASAEFQPSVELTSTPILLRHESVNESVADLNLKISGLVPQSWGGDSISLQVNLFLPCTCTNPSDVVMASASADGRPLAKGRSVPDSGGFGIFFNGVRLTIEESTLQEDLWIRGIRINNHMLAAGSSLRAFVVVTLEKDDTHTSILQRTVAVGILVRGCQFFATRTSNDLVKVYGPVEGRDSARAIRFFTVHFREAFPGAFKAREEMAGSATQGDVLIISSYIPPHFEIFVTVRELPGNFKLSPPARALAVKIDGRGHPLSRISELSAPVWHRRELLPTDEDLVHKYIDTQTQMVRIIRESHDFRAGWEIVRGSAHKYQAAELVFGVMLASPSDIRPPKAIWISGTLAPVSIPGYSGPWSLPSFIDSFQYFDLVLETDAEASAE
jgi:hypothetical protein